MSVDSGSFMEEDWVEEDYVEEDSSYEEYLDDTDDDDLKPRSPFLNKASSAQSIGSTDLSHDGSAMVEFDLGSFDGGSSSEEEPENLEQACRELIALTYPRGGTQGADDMILRCDLKKLYRNLKQQHNFMIHSKKEEETDGDEDEDDQAWESFGGTTEGFSKSSAETFSLDNEPMITVGPFDDVPLFDEMNGVQSANAQESNEETTEWLATIDFVDPWGSKDQTQSATINDQLNINSPFPMTDTATPDAEATEVSDEDDDEHDQTMTEADKQSSIVESIPWLERNDDDPDDYEAACRKLIPIVYQNQGEQDLDTMLRRSNAKDLYRHLEHQHWYLLHTGAISEKGLDERVDVLPAPVFQRSTTIDDIWAIPSDTTPPQEQNNVIYQSWQTAEEESPNIIDDEAEEEQTIQPKDLQVENVARPIEEDQPMRAAGIPHENENAVPQLVEEPTKPVTGGKIDQKDTDQHMEDDEPDIVNWLDRFADDPEDYEDACRKLIAVLYKDDDEYDPETTMSRSIPKYLFRHLKQTYWYQVHMGTIPENAMEQVILDSNNAYYRPNAFQQEETIPVEDDGTRNFAKIRPSAVENSSTMSSPEPHQVQQSPDNTNTAQSDSMDQEATTESEIVFFPPPFANNDSIEVFDDHDSASTDSSSVEPPDGLDRPRQSETVPAASFDDGDEKMGFEAYDDSSSTDSSSVGPPRGWDPHGSGVDHLELLQATSSHDWGERVYHSDNTPDSSQHSDHSSVNSHDESDDEIETSREISQQILEQVNEDESEKTGEIIGDVPASKNDLTEHLAKARHIGESSNMSQVETDSQIEANRELRNTIWDEIDGDIRKAQDPTPDNVLEADSIDDLSEGQQSETRKTKRDNLEQTNETMGSKKKAKRESKIPIDVVQKDVGPGSEVDQRYVLIDDSNDDSTSGSSRVSLDSVRERDLMKLVAEAEEDLGEAFEKEVIDALRVATIKTSHLKKYYDVFTDEYILVPPVAKAIVDNILIEEASKQYNNGGENFPLEYAAVLRTAASMAMDEDIDYDYISTIAVNVEEMGEEERREWSKQTFVSKDSKKSWTAEEDVSSELHTNSNDGNDIQAPEIEPKSQSATDKRKSRIEEELLQIVSDAEEKELDEPFDQEAVSALKVAAMQTTHLKKYYDVFKDEFIYIPPVAKALMDYSLIEEASKHYCDGLEEFPMEYIGALRAVASEVLDEDVDYEYMSMLAVDIEVAETLEAGGKESPNSVHDAILSSNDGSNLQAAEVERKSQSAPDKRKSRIEEELLQIVSDAEEKELDGPFDQEAVSALKVAAMQTTHLKKYYDVFKDEFFYIPPVAKALMDYSLIEEASKHYCDGLEEFPMEYIGALRAVASEVLDEDVDYEYMSMLAVDIEVAETLGAGGKESPNSDAILSANSVVKRVDEIASAEAAMTAEHGTNTETIGEAAEAFADSNCTEATAEVGDSIQSEETRRRARIEDELLRIVSDAEKNGLDESFDQGAVTALKIAAMQTTHLKRYYDFIKDVLIFLPPVAKAIVDNSLLEEASKHYSNGLEPLPPQYITALQAAAGRAVDNSLDYEYMENHAVKLNIANSDDPNFDHNQELSAADALRKKANDEKAEVEKAGEMDGTAESVIRINDEKPSTLAAGLDMKEQAETEPTEAAGRLESERTEGIMKLDEEAGLLYKNYCEEKEELEKEYRELEQAKQSEEQRIAFESQTLDQRRQTEDDRLASESRKLEEVRLADEALFSRKIHGLREKLLAARGSLENERRRFESERIAEQVAADREEERGGRLFGMFGGRRRVPDLEREKQDQSKWMQQKLKEMELDETVKQIEAEITKMEIEATKLEQTRREKQSKLNEGSQSLEQTFFAAGAKLMDETRRLEETFQEAKQMLDERSKGFEENRVEDEAWYCREKAAITSQIDMEGSKTEAFVEQTATMNTSSSPDEALEKSADSAHQPARSLPADLDSLAPSDKPLLAAASEAIDRSDTKPTPSDLQVNEEEDMVGALEELSAAVPDHLVGAHQPAGSRPSDLDSLAPSDVFDPWAQPRPEKPLLAAASKAKEAIDRSDTKPTPSDLQVNVEADVVGALEELSAAVPDHLVGAHQPARSRPSDLDSLASSDVFDPWAQPRPEKPLLAAALKAKQAIDRSDTKPTPSDLQVNEEADVMGGLEELSAAVPDHLLGAHQPVRSLSSDLDSLAPSDVFDPPAQPRPEKPLLAAALKAKQAIDRSDTKPTPSDLQADEEVDVVGDLGEFPTIVPDHLVGAHQPARRRPSDLDSLAPSDVFDPLSQPRPEKPLLAAALKAKQAMDRSDAKPTPSDLQADEEVDVVGDLGEFPTIVPDHLVGAHQPARRRPSDLDSLAPSDVFDPLSQPRPEKPLLAAALKAKEAVEEKRSYSPTASNITDNIVSKGKRLLVLLSNTPTTRLQQANQERSLVLLQAQRIEHEVVDGSDPKFAGRRNRLFQKSGLRGHYPQFYVLDGSKEARYVGTFETLQDLNDRGSLGSLLEDGGDLYRKEFEELLERDEKGENIDEDRLYFLQLYARRQVGEDLNEIELLDLDEFEKAEKVNLGERAHHRVIKESDRDQDTDKSPSGNQVMLSKDAMSEKSIDQPRPDSVAGSVISGDRLAFWKKNGKLLVNEKLGIPASEHSEEYLPDKPFIGSDALVNVELPKDARNVAVVPNLSSSTLTEKRRKAAEARERALLIRSGNSKATPPADFDKKGAEKVNGAANATDELGRTPSTELESQSAVKKENAPSSSPSSKEEEQSKLSPDRLLWWRKNGKRLVTEKLSPPTHGISPPKSIAPRKADDPTKIVTDEPPKNRVDDLSAPANGGSEREEDSDGVDQVASHQLQSTAASSEASSTNGTMSRREILAEKRRQIAEARRGQKEGSLKDSPIAAGEPVGTPDSSTNILEEKKKKRLAESKRLAEKTARAREARLAREAALNEQTRQVELKGRMLSEELEKEESSPPTEDLIPTSQTIQGGEKHPEKQASPSPFETQQSLLPNMVKEVERLSGFIIRYERKLEATCKTVLSVAQKHEENASVKRAGNLPLPEMYTFITEQTWFKEHTSDSFSPPLTLSKQNVGTPTSRLTVPKEKKSMNEVGAESGDAEEKLYIISSLGEAFIKVDGPMVADVGRFLTSLVRFKDGLSKSTMKQNWTDIARLSGDSQSERIHEKLDDIMAFCLNSQFIE